VLGGAFQGGDENGKRNLQGWNSRQAGSSRTEIETKKGGETNKGESCRDKIRSVAEREIA